MTSANEVLLGRLAVALAIGLLMGLERGWEYRLLKEGGRVAGIRTFGMIALLGAIIVQLGGADREALLAAAILAVALLMAVAYWRDTRDIEDVSITTSIAALVAFGLGAIAGMGQLVVASSGAVVVTIVLDFRLELHSMVAHIEKEELSATLRLLLISVVMLPILPNRGFGPWQALNPYQIWWMVVLIAGLSYIGYFANRFLGEERGVIVTGLFGGLTSSTAVTLSLSPIARDREDERPIIAAAILAASAIMFPRLAVLAAAAAPELSIAIAPPFAVATALIAAAAGWMGWSSRAVKRHSQGHDLGTRNPLDLWFALKFGFVLTVMMFASRAAEALLGSRGLVVFAALSGLADAAPITLAVSSMIQQGQVGVGSAAIAVLIASGVNTLVKPAMMTAVAGIRAATMVWIPLIIALAAGAVAAWIQLMR